MALYSDDDVIDFVKTLMGASYNKVGETGFESALAQAKAELSWDTPLVDPFKEYWLVERTKRMVTNILLFESADKFQYKKIYLQHRFKHYLDLLERMDAQFEKVQEENPDLFDTSSNYPICFYLSNGFEYAVDGSDISYRFM